MKIFVTGAAGFLGACIAERAAQAGHDVLAVARGDLPPDLAGLADVQHLQLDLTDAAPDLTGLGMIVHCAAAIPSRVTDPTALYDSNLAMGRTVIDLANHNPGASVINMSSMSVYGPVDGGVISEQTPVAPADPYGESKRAVEVLLDEASDKSSAIRSVSFRLPGMVGARSHANFMSSLADKLLVGETARVLNPDGQFNNIVYGYDLADYLIGHHGNISAGHQVLTIAADETVRVREVAACAAEAAEVSMDRIAFEDAPRQPFIISFDEVCDLGYRPATVLSSVERFVRDKKQMVSTA